MSKFQKLAALLVILGPDNAASILKGMDDATIESVVSEVSGMELLNASEQQEILNEFTDLINRANAFLGGGFNVVEQALLKSLGGFKAANLLGKLSGHEPKQNPKRLTNSEGWTRVQFIQFVEERARTDHRLDSESSASRSCRWERYPPRSVKKNGWVSSSAWQPCLRRLGDRRQSHCRRSRQGTKGSGTTPDSPRREHVAAAMLNAMNKEASKNILTTLEENNPDLGASIKQKMFTFEDLIHLDAQDVQKILRDVDMKDLAMAMKNVPETLIDLILSCMYPSVQVKVSLRKWSF